MYYKELWTDASMTYLSKQDHKCEDWPLLFLMPVT